MIPCRSVSCSSHAATQPANQSTSQSGNFLLRVRQPAGLLLITLAGGIGVERAGWGWGRWGGRERRGSIKDGRKTESGTDEHIHANSLPFDCIKMQTCTHTYTHTHAHTHTQILAHIHRQTPLFRSAAGRIWSLFKSLNYNWLKIHGEPFIWKLGAVQAALWCLIGLKVANPLNKSGRRVVAACVLRMRMWVFTTHLPFISLSFFHCFYVLYSDWWTSKSYQCREEHCTRQTLSLIYFDILESTQFRMRSTFVLVSNAQCV